jgi:hypothetical protein
VRFQVALLFYIKFLNWGNFTYSFGDETAGAICTTDERIAHLSVILF